MLAYQKNGRTAYIEMLNDMYVVRLSDDKRPGCYVESHDYTTQDQARDKAREWCGIAA